MDTTNIHNEVASWYSGMYPTAKADDVLIKLMEEVGELAASFQKNKWSTSIQTSQEWAHKEEDDIGDIMICLLAYCYKRGIDLDKVTMRTWKEVKGRSRKRVIDTPPA